MITYPLNNIDYTAEDAELYFSTRESGVYDGNDFEVTVSGSDNHVTVGTGIAWIHNTKFSGKVVASKEPKTLTLSLPNSVYDRIDAIVIQFDANENATDIIVKEGVASSVPVAPTVVRTESLYELHIYQILRKAGAAVIGIDDLVDLRNNSDYCGIMFDPISSIDATLKKSGYAADAKTVGDAIDSMQNETVPISRGGTGANTAENAWEALGGGTIGKKSVLSASDIPNHSTSKLTSGTLPIERGGTGATTVAGVRNALGLGNTSGALPVANGGTGATSASIALSNLGGVSMKVLWANASFVSDFAAQTISVNGIGDSTTYPYIVITTQRGSVIMANESGATNLQYSTASSGSVNHSVRTATLSSGAVAFSDNTITTNSSNSYSAQTNNAVNKPRAIIGIKGVS